LTARGTAALIDSRAAWARLLASLLIGSIGSVGMWSIVVALPEVAAAFDTARAGASLPFTLVMAGYALGGIGMGRLADRAGIVPSIMLGTGLLALGYAVAAAAASLAIFALGHLAIGLGGSTFFGPLMSDISHWFLKRRGLAVTLVAAGNYLGGAIWPPVAQAAIAGFGWRGTHAGIGIALLLILPPLALLLRARPPAEQRVPDGVARAAPSRETVAMKPAALIVLLSIAGLGCCVAMAMPQVHIVALCTDRGYGPAAGAGMLSLMLGLGIVSRVGSGLIADRIGGIFTLLLGSLLQGCALVLYMIADGLTALYLVSALFGLFQGGIVPCYALIIRRYMPARQAGQILGIVLMATLGGMALGGWISGYIYDLTGSYQAAFLNGIAWNALNLVVVLFLIVRLELGPPARRVAV
jgi:MFS family permease